VGGQEKSQKKKEKKKLSGAGGENKVPKNKTEIRSEKGHTKNVNL
jgi:hypothetical protein